MKFSIIVPAYNTKKYIKRCLDSLLNQTYKDFQIILIDDGSNDGTELICDEYKKERNVVVIHKKHSGVSNARNAGLDAAEGQYIIFVDSDDYIDINTLEILNKKLIEHSDCESIVYKFYNVYSADTSIQKIKGYPFECGIHNIDDKLRFITNTFLEYKIGYEAWCRLYVNKILKDNNIRFNENIIYGEDKLFNLLYYTYIKKVVVIPDYLYFYDRSSIGSATHVIKSHDAFCNIYSIVKNFYDFCVANKLDEIVNSYYLVVNKAIGKPLSYKNRRVRLVYKKIIKPRKIDMSFFNSNVKNLLDKYEMNTHMILIYKYLIEASSCKRVILFTLLSLETAINKIRYFIKR